MLDLNIKLKTFWQSNSINLFFPKNIKGSGAEPKLRYKLHINIMYTGNKIT